MVKIREPKANAANAVNLQPTPDQVEAFAALADGGDQLKKHQHNKIAIRDYKAIRIPFNQYEYEQLEAASKLSGRSKLNFMRYAMLKLAKEVQEQEPLI
jgi:hypothetical protein